MHMNIFNLKEESPHVFNKIYLGKTFTFETVVLDLSSLSTTCTFAADVVGLMSSVSAIKEKNSDFPLES